MVLAQPHGLPSVVHYNWAKLDATGLQRTHQARNCHLGFLYGSQSQRKEYNCDDTLWSRCGHTCHNHRPSISRQNQSNEFSSRPHHIQALTYRTCSLRCLKYTMWTSENNRNKAFVLFFTAHSRAVEPDISQIKKFRIEWPIVFERATGACNAASKIVFHLPKQECPPKDWVISRVKNDVLVKWQAITQISLLETGPHI